MRTHLNILLVYLLDVSLHNLKSICLIAIFFTVNIYPYIIKHTSDLCCQLVVTHRIKGQLLKLKFCDCSSRFI